MRCFPLFARRVIEAAAAGQPQGWAEINEERQFGPNRPHPSTTPWYLSWLEFKGHGEEWCGPAKQKEPAAFFWGSVTRQVVGEEATAFFFFFCTIIFYFL